MGDCTFDLNKDISEAKCWLHEPGRKWCLSSWQMLDKPVLRSLRVVRLDCQRLVTLQLVNQQVVDLAGVRTMRAERAKSSA